MPCRLVVLGLRQCSARGTEFLLCGLACEETNDAHAVWQPDRHSRSTFCTYPGASHLFEEPGTLEEVARLARQWFAKYLNT